MPERRSISLNAVRDYATLNKVCCWFLADVMNQILGPKSLLVLHLVKQLKLLGV